MKITIGTDNFCPLEEPREGNVYPVRGGRGARDGNLMILIAITEPKSCQGEMALMLVVSREGRPCGVTSYGMHHVRDLSPIAFVDGVESLEFTIRSI